MRIKFLLALCLNAKISLVSFFARWKSSQYVPLITEKLAGGHGPCTTWYIVCHSKTRTSLLQVICKLNDASQICVQIIVVIICCIKHVFTTCTDKASKLKSSIYLSEDKIQKRKVGLQIISDHTAL